MRGGLCCPGDVTDDAGPQNLFPGFDGELNSNEVTSIGSVRCRLDARDGFLRELSILTSRHPRKRRKRNNR